MKKETIEEYARRMAHSAYYESDSKIRQRCNNNEEYINALRVFKGVIDSCLNKTIKIWEETSE